MLTKEQARKLTEKILSFSTFPECDVAVSSIGRAFIRFAANGITTSGVTVEQAVSITSTRDGQSGNTMVAEIDDRRLREAVQLTERLAGLSPADPEHAPARSLQKYPEIENYQASTAQARNEVMIPQIRVILESAKSKSLRAAGFFE